VLLPTRLPDLQESNVFARLFPDRVGAACLWLTGQVFPLSAIEELSVRNAVPSRRAEFAGGRHCARMAMAAIGRPAAAVGRDIDRVPIWPEGLVGSITHSDGFCAAAVAENRTYRSIGIDSQAVGTVTAELAGHVLRPDEGTASDHRGRDRVDWATLHFSLKEAAYKAFYPLWRMAIGFHDVRLRIDSDNGTFRAELGIGSSPTVHLEGAYATSFGQVHSACWVG
jgi:4'-phosphopantetheinyl transferase EntD